jgi:tRNA (pseudouridine54-N1)-methyltransferase
MRTFILRARKGSTQWEKIRESVGTDSHSEVIAHFVMNAFFVANGFREDTEVYIILDSAKDFPRTIKLAGNENLSFEGFHENAILTVIEKALKESKTLQKDENKNITSGLSISGYGFEKLIGTLIQTRSLYLLSPKGTSIREITIAPDPVFILSDHLPLPPKIVKSLKNKGLQTISLGKKMLFASQCVTIIHAELDYVIQTPSPF